MQARPNAAVARELGDAMSRGDMEPMESLIDDDIVWHEPGRSEPLRGKQAGVAPDDELTIAGFRIRAVGGRHAFIYAGQPDGTDLGYVVDDVLYHPGDSVHVPDGPIETLLVPMQASC